MNRLAKKSAALFLALVMALSMATCGVKPGGGPGQSAANATTGNTAEGQEESQLNESDGAPQAAEPPAEQGDGSGIAEGEGIFTEPEEEPFGELEEGTGIPGIDAATWMDSDIQEWVRLSDEALPQDDYNLHVNRDWMLSTKIPDGYASYDPITEWAVEVDGRLADILKNPERETDEALIHDQELVQKYYKMWLDWDTRNELGVQPLKDLLEPLLKAETLDDLTAYLSMERTAVSATELLQCDVSADWNNSDNYAVYVMPVDLIFGDSMYYGMMSEDDAMAEPYYNEVIRHILMELGYSYNEATSILEGCFRFEAAIAEYIMTTEEESARDAVEKENNPRTMGQLEEQAGGFPIREMLAAYGADGSDMYILTQPDWLDAMDVLYNEDNVEIMKDYLICYTAQDYATLLDRDCYDIYYRVINGISGATGTKSDEKSASDAVDQFLPMQLGRLYAERYVTDATKEEVTGAVREIMDEYRLMLAEETFLSEDTRKEALKKLDQLKLRIARPDVWEDDSGLDFRGGEEGGNLFSAQDEVGAYWVERMRSRVNGKVNHDYWTSKVQQVNAFYDPTENAITICGGILGGELYDPGMSREELFANVGDTIAHEISHAFDTTGCQFDEKGNCRNWWTQQDREAFAQRADKLAAYYDTIEPFQDTFCVGSQIEGEAIADLVAMKILLRIAAKEEGFDYDRFFRSYAETWRTITTSQNEYYTLSQDTHPLPYLRVNVVVQQFREFYDTYGVKKGDGMYLAPEKRLEVW